MTASTSPRRRGPKGGDTDVRGQLLAAARTEFATRGYQATTVRAVASAAGVDPALVNHYFGGKAGLFRAALEFDVDPVAVATAALAGSADRLGERIVDRFLTMYEEAAFRDGMLALLRTAMADPAAAAVLRDALVDRVLPVLAARAAGPRPERGVALAMSSLIGIVLARHVLALPPVRDATIAELTAQVGPVVQSYFDGTPPDTRQL